MQIVPAKSGWTWVKDGFALFRKNPALWLMLVCGYWLLMVTANLAISLVPVAGSWLALLLTSILIPPFSVSFMVACRTLEQGGKAEFSLLFSGFRDNLPALIVLGGIYLACTLLVLGGSAFADGGLLARWMLFGERPPQEAFADGRMVLGLLVAMLLYTPVMMAFWFGPTLAAWARMSGPQSLFYSFFATLRNWRAFTVYSIVLALIGGFLPMAILIIVVIAAQSVAVLAMMKFIMFPLIMVLVPVVFASFYASYRDIFAPAAAPGNDV